MRLLMYVLSLCFLVCIFIAGAGYCLVTNEWIDVSHLERYNPGSPTIVLDDEGNEWTRFELDKREPIAYAQLPHHVIEAFLSAEDWDFFSHHGVSWKGIARSLLVNMYQGRRAQGASTITQQLVKLLFFDMKKTFSRKIKEQIYALIIEQQFSKQHILEIYLNHVYFGCGIYGVQAACQRFWQKSVEEISIDQAATLAGIIKSPYSYCPLLHPLSSEQRRNVVLGSMFKRGVIDATDYHAALQTPLTIATVFGHECGPYIKEYLRMFLEERVGKKALYQRGYLVQTTINQRMQRIAEQESAQVMHHLSSELKKTINGGMLVFEVQTGAIKALIGGVDFKQSSFNRALQARRQMGSIFKPIVYAAALEQGLSLADVEVDEPLELVVGKSTWAPKNFNRIFNGPITRAYALSRSNNSVTVKTLLQVGIDAVIAMAKRCKLPGPFNPYPSLALGCYDATLKEAAAMFNCFANNGIYVEPYCVEWIKNDSGTKIYKAQVTKERVMSSRVACQIGMVLTHGLQRIKKRYENRWFAGEAISKTGTTNDSRTCWYIGSTPQLTTAVYIGCDDNQSLGSNIYPLHTAFPLWLGFNHQVSTQYDRFIWDASLSKQSIHELTGTYVPASHEHAITLLL